VNLSDAKTQIKQVIMKGFAKNFSVFLITP